MKLYLSDFFLAVPTLSTKESRPRRTVAVLPRKLLLPRTQDYVVECGTAKKKSDRKLYAADHPLRRSAALKLYLSDFFLAVPTLSTKESRPRRTVAVLPRKLLLPRTQDYVGEGRHR